MSTGVLTTASPVLRVAEKLLLATPPQVYAANHDSAERADPSREMQQSGIRHRGVEGFARDGIQNDGPVPESERIVSSPSQEGGEAKGT